MPIFEYPFYIAIYTMVLWDIIGSRDYELFKKKFLRTERN